MCRALRWRQSLKEGEGELLSVVVSVQEERLPHFLAVVLKNRISLNNLRVGRRRDIRIAEGFASSLTCLPCLRV